MNATEIRAELEKLAETGSTKKDRERLRRAWDEIKDSTPASYHAVIESRLNAL